MSNSTQAALASELHKADPYRMTLDEVKLEYQRLSKKAELGHTKDYGRDLRERIEDCIDRLKMLRAMEAAGITRRVG